MKKILFSLSLIGILGLQSCSEDEFLNYEPSDSSQVDVGTITNEEQLQTALFGIYDGLQSPYAYGNYYLTSQELLTDNGFVLFENSNRFTDFYRYEHAQITGGSISNMWTIGYRAIARANFVLSYEGQIEGEASTAYFAEARALRALTLFNLVNFYARPYGTTNQDLGIPIPTEFERDLPIPRSSVAEVYTEITSQLELAAENLPHLSNDRARISKEAVYGILSRVYLYKKDYVKAAEYADLALTAITLVNGSDLPSFYENPLSAETLFGIDFTELDNPGANDAIFATWSQNRYGDTAATTEFYNLMSATDARTQMYELWETNDVPLPYGVLKYNSVDDDIIVVRGAEIVLNKIEALYYTNPSQALTELVNFVSTYRDEAYTFTGSGQPLLDEILKQRRIELAFEGHRYFDMNRYQMDIQKNGNCTANCDMPFEDYRRVFPIPLNEMNTNPALAGQQNPNY